jgi:hypothetical protein
MIKSCNTCAYAKEVPGICDGCLAYSHWTPHPDIRVDAVGQAVNVGLHYIDHDEPASARQIGGDHYARMAIQPFEYIHANGLGFAEGCVVKYVSRWRNKNGLEDLKKARHFLDLLIESEARHA